MEKQKKTFKKPNAENAPQWVNYVAEICVGKEKADGSKGDFYIKIVKDFDAVIGNRINMVAVEEYYNGLVEKKMVTREEADGKLKQYPWVRYILHLPPQEDRGIEDKYGKVTSAGWLNNALSLVESKEAPGKPRTKYLKVDHSFSVVKDQTLNMRKYKDEIKSMKDRGFLDEKAYEKALENASWIHYKISIPPKK